LFIIRRLMEFGNNIARKSVINNMFPSVHTDVTRKLKFALRKPMENVEFQLATRDGNICLFSIIEFN
jgi:hypothetical protein